MEKKGVIAVSGIDTDIGKTVATGAIAYSLLTQGYSVFTQKMVQTGCVGSSEDIAVHRQMMGIGCTDEDRAGLSCPYLFPTPCSPHLAARLAGEEIKPAKIAQATAQLLKNYDILLLEGAGGLSVPLTLDYSFVDYLQEYNLPVILVSSPRLGSINHTLNTLEVLCVRKIRLVGLIYNLHGFAAEIEGQAEKKDIAAMVADSRKTILYYLKKMAMNAEMIELHSPPQFTGKFHQAVEKMVLSFL